jgi:hypothetical protein
MKNAILTTNEQTYLNISDHNESSNTHTKVGQHKFSWCAYITKSRYYELLCYFNFKSVV